MNITKYFITLKSKVDRLDKYLTNPENYKDLNNPFASTLPKTYIWVEKPNTKINEELSY